MILAPMLALLVVPPADDLPDLAPIVAGLEKTEASMRDLAVATQYVQLQKFALPVAEPVKMGYRTEFVVTRDGKSRYDCVGEGVNSGRDGVKTFLRHWCGAYDGEVAKSMDGGVGGPFDFGQIDRHPSYRGVNPREYTTHYNREVVTKTLKDRPPVFAGRGEWQGRPVVMIETPATINVAAYKARFWIDPERRIVVRHALMSQRVPDKSPWQEYSRIESYDHKEIAPGIWLPMRFKYESVDPPKGGKPEDLSWRYEGTNSDWKVNQDPPAAMFQLEFPAAVRVTDRRRPAPAEPKK